MKAIASMILLWAVSILGCNSSKTAPKPLNQYPALSSEDAKKVLQQQEAKQPCSEQNLRNANDEQRKKCDPGHGMLDNIQPQGQPSQSPPKTKLPHTVPTKS